MKQNESYENLITEKLVSTWTFNNIVLPADEMKNLTYFVKEYEKQKLLDEFGFQLSNKVLLHGLSDCGKTLTAYAIAGELKKTLYVIDTEPYDDLTDHLTKLFRLADADNAILLFENIDKYQTNILKIIDYLSDDCILIATTHNEEWLSRKIFNKFDLDIYFDMPDYQQTRELIDKIISKSPFRFKNASEFDECVKVAKENTYREIQKNLIKSLKYSLLNTPNPNNELIYIDTQYFIDLFYQWKILKI